MIDGHTIDPARGDPFTDLVSIGLVDPGRIRPILLRDRIRNSRARVAAVVPGRARQTGQDQRLPLRSRDQRQLPDEVVLGVEESDGSVVVGVAAGSCSLI